MDTKHFYIYPINLHCAVKRHHINLFFDSRLRTMPVISTLLRRSELQNQSLLDPVQKFRVSQPEALIDTDFEYGVQGTKWEQVELVNNIPTFYATSGDETISISDVRVTQNSKIVTVTTSVEHGLDVGSPIIIVGLYSTTAEGSFVVSKKISSYIFNYIAKDEQTITGSIFDQYSSYLYAARLYQGTQYTSENIHSIETDGATSSTIRVITRYPNGFSSNMNLLLANSVGYRKTDFDASQIIIADLTTSTCNVITNNTNPTYTGLRSENVNPYDWQGMSTTTFNTTAVNAVGTNTIFASNHGYPVGARNYGMYVCPPDSSPVGGLSNYNLYAVNAIDPHSFTLREITCALIPGLFGTRVGVNWGININNFYTNTVTAAYLNAFSTISNNFTFTAGAVNTSWEFIGYIRPWATGLWGFRFTCEDTGAMWLKSASIEAGNFESALRPTWNGTDSTGTNNNAYVVKTSVNSLVAAVGPDIALESGVYYPVRIAYGNEATATNASLLFEYKVPGSSTWSSAVPASVSSNLFWSFGPPFNVEPTDIPISVGSATDTYGPHALFKSYLIDSVTGLHTATLNGANVVAASATGATANFFNVQVNTQNGFGAGFPLDQPVCFFSYQCNVQGFGFQAYNATNAALPIPGFSTLLPGGLSGANMQTIIPHSKGNLYPTATRSANLYSDGQYTSMLVQADKVLTIGTGTATTALDFKCSGGAVNTNGNPVRPVFGRLHGITWVTPIHLFNERNTIYIPNHEMYSGDTVTYNIQSGVGIGTWSAVSGNTSTITTIPNGTNFRVNNVTPNLIQLISDTDKKEVNLANITNSTLSFTKSNIYFTNRDSIYAPNHGFPDNQPVIYKTNNNPTIPGLVNNTTYYTYSTTTNTFKLSSNIPTTTVFTYPPSALTSPDTTYIGLDAYITTNNAGVNTAYHAFDKNTDTYWASTGYAIDTGIYRGSTATAVTLTLSGASTNILGEWLQIQLPLAINTIGYHMSVGPNYQQGVAPSSWILAGSTNGSTWIQVDYKNGYFQSDWGDGTSKYFSINETSVAYNYYRLILLATTGGPTQYVNISDLTFYTRDTIGINLNARSTGTHTFLSSERASDGNYAITSIVNSNTFDISAGVTIPHIEVTFDPRQTLNMQTSYFYVPNHRMIQGCRVIYDPLNNTPIAPLTSNASYYINYLDTSKFRLSSSYSDAKTGKFIEPTTNGTGSNHVFKFMSLLGESIYTCNVSTTAFTNVLTVGSNSVDLISLYRTGDTMRVNLGNSQSTTLSVQNAALNTGTRVITTSAHTFYNGDSVVYTGSTANGLSNNYFYYVNSNTTTSIRLHNTYDSAINNGNDMPVLTGTNLPNVANTNLIRLAIDDMFISPVSEVNSKTQVTTTLSPGRTVTTGQLLVTTNLFPRSDGYVNHRPYDGGVEIVAPVNPDSSIIRQTRRYFRYQSGKGLQMSEAVNFAASYEVLNITRSGTTATVTARKTHRLTVNTVVKIENAINANGQTTDGQGRVLWNGYYKVASLVNTTQFTIDLSARYTTWAATTLDTNMPNITATYDAVASGSPTYTVKNWTGCVIRVGMFDDQNGLFFEYDGAILKAVRRSSTAQLSGSVNVTQNSPQVIGISTKFVSNVTIGQNIVIRGQTYRVVSVLNDTEMYIQPPYRGKTSQGAIISRISDEAFPQSQWTIDKCDGTGPSGYNLDITKAQMIFIDYAWYGAGKVRYGFRTTTGEIVYCHEIVHNNQKNESYMRSGNLPGRYEVTNVGNPSYVPAVMHWGTSVIMDGRFDDDKAYLFTASGNVFQYYGPLATTQFTFSQAKITGISQTATTIYDPIQRQNVSAFQITLSSLTQATSGQDSTSRALSLKSGTPVTTTGGTQWLQNNTFLIGTPVYFNATTVYIYVNKRPLRTTATANLLIGKPSLNDYPPANGFPLISVRLAPSVDNGRQGLLGAREIINRMQLDLDSVGILSTHDVEIRLLLNAFPANKNWQQMTVPSLSQLIYHTKDDIVTGGTQIFSFRVPGGGIIESGGSGATAYKKRASNVTSNSLSELATLGNSIIGGDGIFPNGPDVLSVVAVFMENQNDVFIDGPFQITGRVTWTESQA